MEFLKYNDIRDIKKCIKQNKPDGSYPDPDDFEDYEEYAEAYDNEKASYMRYISTLFNFKSVDEMLKAVYPDNPEEAEYELFEFFYDNMVNEDYFDVDDYSDDYYNDEDNYYNSDDY